jgi:1-deoxy-D-xylulose-5-phosphate reductoisomerase
LKEALAGRGVEVAAGPDAVIEAALRPADMVVAAIVGTAGVAPTYAALAAGRTVALANKESLVCAGGPVMRAAAAAGARILPMDSEHNAIFQALGDAPVERIEKMIVTASGGPFRTWSAAQIAAATREQALAHPNWAMGPKISIDSATMMNKGLELIEAHHLFGVPAERLDVLVHPQSIVHGLVSFADGMVVAGLAHPDMRVPIAHCLGWPERLTTPARRLDLAALGGLSFEAPDLDRFPALRVAIAAMRAGGAAPTVLNAANEVAVAAFLEGRIGFSAISALVERVCEAVGAAPSTEPGTVAEALAINDAARQRAGELLARLGLTS